MDQASAACYEQSNRVKASGYYVRGGAIRSEGFTRLFVTGGTNMFVGNMVNGTSPSSNMEWGGGGSCTAAPPVLVSMCCS